MSYSSQRVTNIVVVFARGGGCGGGCQSRRWSTCLLAGPLRLAFRRPCCVLLLASCTRARWGFVANTLSCRHTPPPPRRQRWRRSCDARSGKYVSRRRGASGGSVTQPAFSRSLTRFSCGDNDKQNTACSAVCVPLLLHALPLPPSRQDSRLWCPRALCCALPSQKMSRVRQDCDQRTER